ncbi:MAG: hypothetical protein STHCBS139747_007855 [Sporothrix thermara]
MSTTSSRSRGHFRAASETATRCFGAGTRHAGVIVKGTPALVDWKLVYHDPLPTWTTAHGRTLLLGDTAHPFLSTRAHCTTQTIKNGATLTLYLRRAGKARKTGKTTRDLWHKTD